MQHTRDRAQRRPAADDRGFTLIELLSVVVIIGVLVAIAIPVYLNYRKGAENKSAQSDVRGAVIAIEEYFTENGNTYPDDEQSAEGQNITFAPTSGTTDQVVTVSEGNIIAYNKVDNTTYYICGQNSNGKTLYVYNSSKGGSVAKSSKSKLEDCVSSGE